MMMTMDVEMMPLSHNNMNINAAGNNSVDSITLRRFLWSQSFVSSPNEGYFAVLTNDLRKEVWTQITNHLTFAKASQVNKKWRNEMQVAWKQFAQQNQLLNDLDFFEERGKNWKWLLNCKLSILQEVSDNKSGCGNCTEANGNYEGEWKLNNKEGLGKKYFTDKSVYMGAWKNNMKEGKGEYLWQDNTKYSGDWKEDKYNGYGIKKWSDGDEYEGEWKSDKKNGRGNYKWSNGDIYNGEWNEDKQHGKGTFSWATGVKYVGKFAENMRCDTRATLTWPNGDKYEGGFKENMIEGEGIYSHVSGDKYIGEWKGSMRQGRATYIYRYGGRFVGYFEDDERNGAGVYEWPDGDRFEGTWKRGSRVGSGRFISKAGKVIKQTWDELPHSNYAEFMPSKYTEDDDVDQSEDMEL